MNGGSVMSEKRTRSVRRTESGGLCFRIDGKEEMSLRPGRGGWQVRAENDLDGWLLERGEAGTTGFILLRDDGRTEEGRTMPPPGNERCPDLRYLLTSGGSMYRIRLRGPRDGRYELQGWETPGAYLTARPGDRDWTISPEPAAAGLSEIRPLLILFAAEILDAEEPLAAA
jgi:hypothetical protein